VQEVTSDCVTNRPGPLSLAISGWLDRWVGTANGYTREQKFLDVNHAAKSTGCPYAFVLDMPRKDRELPCSGRCYLCKNFHVGMG